MSVMYMSTFDLFEGDARGDKSYYIYRLRTCFKKNICICCICFSKNSCICSIRLSINSCTCCIYYLDFRRGIVFQQIFSVTL